MIAQDNKLVANLQHQQQGQHPIHQLQGQQGRPVQSQYQQGQTHPSSDLGHLQPRHSRCQTRPWQLYMASPAASSFATCFFNQETSRNGNSHTVCLGKFCWAHASGRWRCELTTRCRQLAVWLCITTIVSSLLLAGVLGLLWLTVEEEVNHHIPRLAWQQSRAHLQQTGHISQHSICCL